MTNYDYSKTIFAKGIVCVNANNETKCVVLNGDSGSEHDRASKVLEMGNTLFINNVPNRALVPTGEHVDLNQLESILKYERG